MRPTASWLLLPLAEVPMTLSGLSRHDVANALAATSAGLAIGLPREAVLEGLRTFSSEDNLGRMNLWLVDGCVVSLDLAHLSQATKIECEGIDGAKQIVMFDNGNPSTLDAADAQNLPTAR